LGGIFLEYQIEKYIDINALVGLLEYYYKLTGIAYGFVDINGNVLGDIGWNNICTSFHRKSKETAARCLESDRCCKNLINKNDKYTVYKCRNGLMEAFVPVYMGDYHVANLFIGQMLFDEPDMDYFIGQANEFGFDEKEYIKALKEVPIVTKDELDIYMDFYTSLASMISSVMYNNYKNICVEEKLKTHNERLETEIKEQTDELKIKNNKLREYMDEKEKSQRELIAINKKLIQVLALVFICFVLLPLN
jgi:ligand-binding sensor protein